MGYKKIINGTGIAKNSLILGVGLILIAGILFGYFGMSLRSSPKTQVFDLSIGHQDSYARSDLIDIGAPEETKIATFYRWQPSTLVVHKGDKVVLNVANHSKSRTHSFILPAFGLDTGELPNTPAGTIPTTVTLEFVADKAGIFQFACGIPPDPTATPKKCSAEHSHQIGWLTVLER